MGFENLIIYLIAINLFAALLCIIDKSKARHNRYRISEKTLFTVSALGGSVGMYITMRLIRHKTLHKRFMVGLPLMIIFQIALILILLTRN